MAAFVSPFPLHFRRYLTQNRTGCTSRSLHSQPKLASVPSTKIYIVATTSHTRQQQQLSSTESAVKQNVVVIGGGAAGYLCSIRIARRAVRSTSVTLLESTSKPLSKVLISGGGRCNVTSSSDTDDAKNFSSNYPRGQREMIATLSKFGANETMEFFQSEGVKLKIEQASNKVFPDNDKSSTIANALHQAASESHVIVKLNHRVSGLEILKTEQNNQMFKVMTSSGDIFYAHFIVIATGNSKLAWSWIQKCLNHNIVTPVPSLFTFTIINDIRLDGLAGLSVSDVIVQLDVQNGGEQQKNHEGKDKNKNKRRRKHSNNGLTQRGSLLITHWGLSGPAILSLSSFGARELYESNYKMQITVNWLPAYTRNELCNVLYESKKAFSNRLIHSTNPFRSHIPKRLWSSLLQYHKINPDLKWSELSKHSVENCFINMLQYSTFHVSSKGQFKEEFVTAGGVALNQINMSTFESKLVDNLYFAGEALDVDGKTGGYNLQFAWSSGWIAGNSIADKILSQQQMEINT